MAIITISRGSLSGGRGLAERLAATLQHLCISREDIVEKTAADFGIDQRELTEAVGKPPSFWDRVSRNRQLYLKYVRAVLMEHASSGRLVYHGHAGHFLVKDVPGVLRVRLIAPMEKRIQAAMAERHYNPEEALSYIHQIDKERARWTRFLYNVDWDDPALFDLTINLEKMSTETAADVVMGLAKSPEFAVSADALVHLQGMALAAHVEAALQANPETRGVDVTASAEHGAVHLGGNIETERLRPIILGVVQGVRGVESVVDEMVVEKLSQFPT
jgi:cytidylate kinase